MGIANFYNKVFKKYFSDSIRDSMNQTRTQHSVYDCIAVDLNHWLHTYYDENSEAMAEKCVQYLSSLPAPCIIIAMDGVCPEPKLDEQRRRRQTATRLDISVGTDYICSFSEHLQRLLATLHCKTVYYSDYTRPGEGEHKICHIIKSLEFERVLIISIDADIIMLCILNNLYNVNILRKTRWYTHIIDISIVLLELQRYKCSPLNFFIHVLFMGNDYLCNTKYNLEFPLKCLESKDSFDYTLLTENVEDYESDCVKNYIYWMNWICEYYRNYKIEWIPDIPLPKEVNFCHLQRVKIDNKFPVRCQIQSIEYQILYTFPNVGTIPCYLKDFFNNDSLILTPEIAKAFITFWDSLFESEKGGKWLCIRK